MFGLFVGEQEFFFYTTDVAIRRWYGKVIILPLTVSA